MQPSSSRSAAKSGAGSTPSFVCEIPLRVAPAEEHRLNVRLEAARQVYNACLGEALKRARLLKERREYRKAQRLPRGAGRTAAFRTVRRSVAFSDAALQRYAVQLRQAAFKDILDVHVVQKLASRAYTAVNAWLLGERGRPRFKGRRQLDTVEGKSNQAGLRWRDDHIEWFGIHLHALLDPRDPVVAHALACRIKYVRLVRRKLRGRDRFYAQLVCEGRPYLKPQHWVGKGEVGLDLGPSTIAVVGEGVAWLETFCNAVVRNRRDIRRLQRKLDRQRRANNPANYLPDGRIRPGPKRWVKSTRQRKTEVALAELLRRESAQRKTLHGRLANRVLAVGRTIKMEKISYRAWQRRYGRTVEVRAPGLFVAMLRRKAASAGGAVVEFPTRSTKLSQVCHGCGAIERKSLAQRVHACACGVEMQRDLYSAFLAWCVGDDHRLDADLARERWAGAEPLLRAAWSQATQPANGRALRPRSFGSKLRSQSGSPAKEGIAETEARDMDAPLRERESPGEVEVVPFRTPRQRAVGRFRGCRIIFVL